MGFAHQRWSWSQLPFIPLDACRRYLPAYKLEDSHVQEYISQIANNNFFCLLNLQWKCDRNKPSTKSVRFLNPQTTKNRIMKTQSCWSSCILVAVVLCMTHIIYQPGGYGLIIRCTLSFFQVVLWHCLVVWLHASLKLMYKHQTLHRSDFEFVMVRVWMLKYFLQYKTVVCTTGYN